MPDQKQKGPYQPCGYVAYCCEHMKDGVNETAKLFDYREHALRWINELANGFTGRCCSFKLFELGREITLEPADVETPQPPKVERRFKARQD